MKKIKITATHTYEPVFEHYDENASTLEECMAMDAEDFSSGAMSLDEWLGENPTVTFEVVDE